MYCLHCRKIVVERIAKLLFVYVEKFKIESKGNPLWKNVVLNLYENGDFTFVQKISYSSYLLLKIFIQFLKKKKGKEKKKDSLKLFENYFIAKLASRKIKLSQSIISAMLKLFHHQRIAIYSIHKAKLHSGEIIEVTNRLPITFSLGKIRNGGRGGNRQISRSRSRSGVSKMIKNVNCQGGRNSKRLEERATVKLWLSIVDNSSIRISHFFF